MASANVKVIRLRLFVGALGIVIAAFGVGIDMLGIGDPGFGLQQAAIVVPGMLMLSTALTTRKLGLQILLSCWTFYLSLLAFMLVLGNPVENLRYAAYRAKLLISTNPKKAIGIYRTDERTGWSYAPNTTGNSSGFAFDVEYNIDENGHRVMQAPSSPRFNIVLIGGSYTFGFGVEDSESYAAELAREY